MKGKAQMPSMKRLLERLNAIIQSEYQEEFKTIQARPEIDNEEAFNIFTGIEGIDREEHILVHYHFEPGEGLSIGQVAARIAMISTLRTLSPLPFENKFERLKKAGKVLARQENGQVIIGFPLELIGGNEGLAQLLLLISAGVEYIYTKQFWIEQIEFPRKYLENLQGPRFGIVGIRELFNIQSRPIIGLSIEPIQGASLKVIDQQCRESLLGGVDCIVDDVLLHDPDGELSFKNRIPALTRVAREVSEDTGEKKLYVANIGASIRRYFEYAKIAQEEGVAMLKVNAFTMSFSALEELSNHPNLNIPIITTSMGVSLLTRSQKPFGTGISEAVVAKLSRLAGADGYHLGSIDTGCFIQEPSSPPIIALQSRLHNMRPTMIIIQGDITLANAWNNISVFGPDIIMESCSGILGYPDGALKGAQSLRKLVTTIPYSLTPTEARERLRELGSQDPSFGRGLVYFGYK